LSYARSIVAHSSIEWYFFARVRNGKELRTVGTMIVNATLIARLRMISCLFVPQLPGVLLGVRSL